MDATLPSSNVASVVQSYTLEYIPQKNAQNDW